MRALKVAVPATLIMTGLMLCTMASYGKQEYMKKEGVKSCTTCHSKMEGKEAMAKNLNETGKCYAENDHSLAKCKVPDKK
ncbi:MAG: hypothetical protein LAQ69_42410 [Acidobacteriia bacterium]|nr:hypothetical protein [Terriglobia bacterium]